MMPATRLLTFQLSLERACLLQLRRLAHRLHPPPARSEHLRTGERGEIEALFFLRRHGYVVVERRWRSPEHNGDLDLIAWEGSALCFIEVKTRSARDLTPAASAVDEAKRRMLRQMARAYLRTLPRSAEGVLPIRFDVVSVYLLEQDRRARVECELLREAFLLQTEPHEPIRPRYGV